MELDPPAADITSLREMLDTEASAPVTAGRWTASEHALFVQGLRQFGKDWKRIAELIPSRTVVQLRTHAQKYFQKLAKAGKVLNESGELESLPPGAQASVSISPDSARVVRRRGRSGTLDESSRGGGGSFSGGGSGGRGASVSGDTLDVDCEPDVVSSSADADDSAISTRSRMHLRSHSSYQSVGSTAEFFGCVTSGTPEPRDDVPAHEDSEGEAAGVLLDGSNSARRRRMRLYGDGEHEGAQGIAVVDNVLTSSACAGAGASARPAPIDTIAPAPGSSTASSLLLDTPSATTGSASGKRHPAISPAISPAVSSPHLGGTVGQKRSASGSISSPGRAAMLLPVNGAPSMYGSAALHTMSPRAPLDGSVSANSSPRVTSGSVGGSFRGTPIFRSMSAGSASEAGALRSAVAPSHASASDVMGVLSHLPRSVRGVTEATMSASTTMSPRLAGLSLGAGATEERAAGLGVPPSAAVLESAMLAAAAATARSSASGRGTRDEYADANTAPLTAPLLAPISGGASLPELRYNTSMSDFMAASQSLGHIDVAAHMLPLPAAGNYAATAAAEASTRTQGRADASAAHAAMAAANATAAPTGASVSLHRSLSAPSTTAVPFTLGSAHLLHTLPSLLPLHPPSSMPSLSSSAQCNGIFSMDGVDRPSEEEHAHRDGAVHVSNADAATDVQLDALSSGLPHSTSWTSLMLMDAAQHGLADAGAPSNVDGSGTSASSDMLGMGFSSPSSAAHSADEAAPSLPSHNTAIRVASAHALQVQSAVRGGSGGAPAPHVSPLAASRTHSGGSSAPGATELGIAPAALAQVLGTAAGRQLTEQQLRALSASGTGVLVGSADAGGVAGSPLHAALPVRYGAPAGTSFPHPPNAATGSVALPLSYAFMLPRMRIDASGSVPVSGSGGGTPTASSLLPAEWATPSAAHASPITDAPAAAGSMAHPASSAPPSACASMEAGMQGAYGAAIAFNPDAFFDSSS